MAIDEVSVHVKFKLNGISYTKIGLRELAYDLIKEGASFEKSIGNFLSNWLGDKPHLEVKTSGSTGKPKNILLRKQQMVNSALATGEYFGLQAGNKALLCMSSDYIAGKMMLVRAMVLGLELDYVKPSSSPLNGLSKGYDFAAMVPLQLEGSMNKIETIKTLIVGGAPFPSALLGKIQKKNTSIYETYGMTETITHVAARDVRLSSLTTISTSSVEAQNQSHFKALPNVLFTLDERDCLVITAPRISDNPVVTNDLVKLISETEFEWLGRYDNVINSGGIKLFPEQIEAKLIPLLSNRFFVAGIPDQRLGQKLILVVEGTIDSNVLEQILEKGNYLERFEIPKIIYTLPEFIDTDMGKIRRKENINLLNY